MGRNSNIYICERFENRFCVDKPFVGYTTLAAMEMKKVYEDGWDELFATPFHNDPNCEYFHFYGFDFGFAIDQEGDLSEDMFGKPVGVASLKSVIEWTQKQIDNGNDYRRLKPFLALLKAYDNPNDWGNDIVVLRFCY